MNLAVWKRTLLAGLVTASVAGGTLVPMVAGHASAARACFYEADGTKVCINYVPQ
jgi:hypothetical protein